MAGELSFDVTLEEIARDGIYDQVAFRLPADLIPGEALARITGRLNGRPFEANASPAEDGQIWVFVPLELRREIGVDTGDRVRAEIDPPRDRLEVDAPDDFRAALGRAGAGLDFEQLPAGQRGEYARWVAEAGGEERAGRIRRAVEGILEHRPPGDLKQP